MYDVCCTVCLSYPCNMSSSYPNQASVPIINNNTTFYPHSVAALASNQGPFEGVNQIYTDLHSMDTRSVTINNYPAEVLGTPLRQVNTSSIAGSQANDLSSTSPYRIAASANEAITSSPYRQVITESKNSGQMHSMKPTSVEGGSSIPGIISMQGNVIISDRPLSSADFETMMGGGGHQFIAPPMQQQFQPFHQMPFTSFPSTQFSPAFPQGSSGFISASPMTPRLMMGGTQSLTPRGLPPMAALPTGTQLGLTPRSYQEQMSAMMMPAPMMVDPMMGMFAETFRNQCIAMSQYYAAHPDEKMDSPKSTKAVDPAPAPALTKPDHHYFMRRRMMPSLKTIVDHENHDTANQTPDGSDINKKPISAPEHDAVLDLLDQLADHEDPAQYTSDSRNFSTAQAPAVGSPIIRSNQRQPSLFQRLGCGSIKH